MSHRADEIAPWAKAAHDVWCADDDWNDLTHAEQELWEKAVAAGIQLWWREHKP